MVARFDLFSVEGRGFESKSVANTRATTDKNDPFLNLGSNSGKSGWTKMEQNAIWGSGVELKIPDVEQFCHKLIPPFLQRRLTCGDAFFESMQKIHTRVSVAVTYRRWKIARGNHLTENWFFHFLANTKWDKNKSLCHFAGIIHLLIELVTSGEPTRGICDLHDVGTFHGGILGKRWLMHSKTRYSPWLILVVGVFLLLAKERSGIFGFDYMDVDYW